jgi:AraC family transcriptional regulator of adaptative response / DNA-3-methyladenine glycosylase II
LAPHGTLPWSLQDASQTLAHQAMDLLDRLDTHPESLEAPRLSDLAQRLGISARHLRRIVELHLGVSPLQYRQTRRLLLAKQLLCDTRLAIPEIAHLSGFGSQRAFSAAFKAHYRLNPSQCRRSSREASPATLRLAYRPPLAIDASIDFLCRRAVPGLEHWEAATGEYRRVLRLPHAGSWLAGWIGLRFDRDRPLVHLQVGESLHPVLPQVLMRTRAALDLDADPLAVEACLGEDFPGCVGWRVPGTWDGFELAVRAVLGQQVTVQAGRTLTQRLVARLGTRFAEASCPELQFAFPTPAQLLDASDDQLGTLGIVRQRQGALRALARETLADPQWLDPGLPTDDRLRRLIALPGIGDWTAQYIALRALRWPDAFPAGDLVVQQRLGVREAPKPAEAARAQARRWQPWRGYAVIRLWHGELR